MVTWFFRLDGREVLLQARIEQDGLIGDARERVAEGQEFFGIRFEEMAAAKSGAVTVDRDGHAKLEK